MKEIKVFTASISRDGDIRHEFLSFYQKYSNEGRLLEEIIYSDENEIESKTLFEYDPLGRLIKEMNYFDDEEFSDGRELEYNENDMLDNVRITYADGSETFQKYERKPNFSKISFFNEDEELEYTEERKIDDNDNLLDFSKYDPKKKLEYHLTFSYDDHGRLSESVENNIVEDFRSITRMEYDDKNNLHSEIAFTEKGNIISSREYKYNAKNEVEEEKVNDYFITYVTDEHGHRIERKVTNESGQLEELTTYSYDEEGRVAEERFYKSMDLNQQDLFSTAYLRKRYEY